MDAIREYIKKPWVIAVAAFIVGLLIGWLFLGWVVFPVTWTDAAPVDLLDYHAEDYLRMAIDSYALTGDQAVAADRFEFLGEKGPELLATVQAAPGAQMPERIAAFAAAAGASVTAPQVTTQPGTPETNATQPVPTTETETEEAPRRSILGWLIPVLCVITLLLAGGLVGFYLLRGRAKSNQQQQEVEEAVAAKEAMMTDFSGEGEEPPIGQFMASYKIGDDMFDDSFSIDSPSGEFLGECGVGISADPFGVGEPKKATAFEVWLFDKNDIQTVTKVLMSAHAFSDETIRQRLAAKGEPVEAVPGGQVVLETASLQLVARVVDMQYGEGALPENSFFDSLILELAVWQK